ncbi:MAG: hypothetical protein ACRDU8_01570 [Egibacteraceae bacterium]
MLRLPLRNLVYIGQILARPEIAASWCSLPVATEAQSSTLW